MKISHCEALLIPKNLSRVEMGPACITLFTFIGLLPWLLVQLEMALNTNHAWLFTAATRLLDGGDHLHDVYEPNPPLSILLYYPAALLSKYFDIAADYSIYLVGLLGLGFSTAALWFFLKPLTLAIQTEKFLFCAVYVIAGCIIPSNMFFAERDEFVFWGLVPFLLAQLMITHGACFKGLKYYLCLFCCSLLILVKPHYVIFPALLFIHRLVVRRDLRGFFRAPDLWAITAACAGYTLTVLIFFQSYLFEVLPNFVQFYIAYTSEGIWGVLAPRGFLCAMILISLRFVPADRIYKNASITLILAGLLAFSLYVVQMKGFGYHLIPGDLFIFLGGIMLLYGALRRLVAAEIPRIGTVLILTLLIAYTSVPLKTQSQTHESYRKLMLPETVKACGHPCPFFVFSENMEMIWQTSVYTGEEHASRFPGLWWLHSMLEHGYDPADQRKYAEMVAEDLARYDPKMLIIAVNLKTVKGDTFNFIDFFSNNENFRKQISRYKFEKKITDDAGLYFKGTTGGYQFLIDYDVYIRK